MVVVSSLLEDELFQKLTLRENGGRETCGPSPADDSGRVSHARSSRRAWLLCGGAFSSGWAGAMWLSRCGRLHWVAFDTSRGTPRPSPRLRPLRHAGAGLASLDGGLLLDCTSPCAPLSSSTWGGGFVVVAVSPVPAGAASYQTRYLRCSGTQRRAGAGAYCAPVDGGRVGCSPNQRSASRPTS
jgi:hypothetical protein